MMATPVEGWKLSPLNITAVDTKLDAWDSEALNQNTLLQYTSVRWAAETLNPRLIQTIQQQSLASNRCAAVTIINFKIQEPGLLAQAYKNAHAVKQQYPQCKVVADTFGQGKNRWQLDKDKNMTLVVSAEGRVLFRSDSVLSEDEERYVLALLQS
ncbi:MAG: hypothetical protein HRU20_01270 [Pseudomonadales bacterium]|nr:hypothetical protein [Pseudomonadales bacterium]